MDARNYIMLSTRRDTFTNDLGAGYIREFEKNGALFLDYEDLYLSLGNAGARGYILKTVEECGAEVLIYQSSPSDFHFSLDFFKDLRKKVFMVMTSGDPDHYFDIRDVYYAQCFDLVIVYDYTSRFRFLQYGIEAISFYSAFDGSRYRKTHGAKKDIDVSFVGDLENKIERQEHIDSISGEGFKVETFGTGTTHGQLALSEMVDLFNRTKINLNFTKISGRNAIRKEPRINYRLRQVKGRMAEIALSGGFVLTESVPGLEEVFEPGREIAVFDSKQDLLHKIRYFLSHDKEREEIAESGYRRAVRDYESSTAIPRLIERIEAKRLKRSKRPQEIYTDGPFMKYYTTFRVRMITRFINLRKWRPIIEELEIILRTKRLDLRKASGILIFSVFPNFKRFYLQLRNANRY